MARHAYNAGDTVSLKSGTFRKPDTDRICDIISVLPEAYGEIQYRVKFVGEGVERHITEADIDSGVMPKAAVQVEMETVVPASSWINASSIKIRK